MFCTRSRGDTALDEAADPHTSVTTLLHGMPNVNDMSLYRETRYSDLLMVVSEDRALWQVAEDCADGLLV